jgi:hypothetical protein
VAASTDATGAAALGGDWTLEAATGPIETGSAFTAAAEENFDALLATPTPRTNEFKVNIATNTPADGTGKSQVVVAELTGGGFVAVWMADGNPDGNLTGIFAQRFDNLGNPLGTMFQVNGATAVPNSTGTSGVQQLPSVS